ECLLSGCEPPAGRPVRDRRKSGVSPAAFPPNGAQPSARARRGGGRHRFRARVARSRLWGALCRGGRRFPVDHVGWGGALRSDPAGLRVDGDASVQNPAADLRARGPGQYRRLCRVGTEVRPARRGPAMARLGRMPVGRLLLCALAVFAAASRRQGAGTGGTRSLVDGARTSAMVMRAVETEPAAGANLGAAPDRGGEGGTAEQVLLFSFNYPPHDGGVARLCAELVAGLQRRGVD